VDEQKKKMPQKGENRAQMSADEHTRARRLGEKFRQFRTVSLAAVLPLVMVVGPVLGYFLGDWIGGQMGWGVWTNYVGLAFGAAASLQQTILIIRRILKEL
jgi:hypothetical protein